jgi:hypothetical protein
MLFTSTVARSNLLRAASWLLLITVGVVLLNHALDGIRSSHSRSDAVERASAKGIEGIRQKTIDRPVLVLHSTVVKLTSSSSLSLLRFDFKQNLRIWPVLSNDLERSPPYRFTAI